MAGLSPEKCIEKLQGFSLDIDRICELFDDHGFVKQECVDIARGQLQALKSSLKMEYASRDKVSAQKSMSSVEKAFYFPSIQEAHTRIHVKFNSIPSGEWLMELRDAQSSLKYYLHDLQEMVDSATE
jgi:hypothetical protein